MSVISAGELASMRAEAERFLPDTCTIERPLRTPDDYGGDTIEFDTIATGVPCQVAPPAPLQGQPQLTRFVLSQAHPAGSREDVEAVLNVSMPQTTDVAEGDYITITSQHNERLRVRAVLVPQSWEILKRVETVQ